MRNRWTGITTRWAVFMIERNGVQGRIGDYATRAAAVRAQWGHDCPTVVHPIIVPTLANGTDPS